MFKPGDSGGTGAIPTDLLFKTGMLLPYAGAAAPSGWLLADGSTVSQVTYAALFAVCGTTFNTGGEPVGTFRLPNMISRSVIGAGTTGGLTAVPLGTYKGEENHVLTTAELASHNHGVTDPGHNHTQNAHTHTVTDPGHNHTQNAHTHTVTDPGHNHTQNAHTHTVTDPGHTHNLKLASSGDNNGLWHRTVDNQLASSGDGTWDATDYGNSVVGSSTGVSNQNSTATNNSTTTGVTNANATATNKSTTTGVTNANATATNNSNTTGLTTNNNGSNTGHNTIHPVLGLTYIIKY